MGTFQIVTDHRVKGAGAVPGNGLRNKDSPFARIKLFNFYPFNIFGKNTFGYLRPFDKEPGIAVKIIFVSYIIQFFNVLNTVKLKMINYFTRIGPVFIDQ